ncbi:phosphoethanolamine transferase [Haemophilus paracuniculus]|uniref:phosphoethanolamine transferase n=1 Tax=Haemophilus paracuniculus TaxID=734 RepID=UPI001FE2644C|nr:phosphoethanolamine transferase [Haemophilus paracuniculus]
MALYIPIGSLYGQPSYESIISVFATDVTEAKEFLKNIPSKLYLYSFLCIPFFVISRFFLSDRKILKKGQPIVLLALIVFLLPKNLISFQDKFVTELSKVIKELNVLNGLAIKSDWGQSKLNDSSKYDDYVLIIGESARRDYHNAYGYPVENTPFMSNSNGVLINGFTSPRETTAAALKLMLTKPNYEKQTEQYNFSLIDLIKSAGIETYWISNQGYLSGLDTPIAALAKKSENKIFLKWGDYRAKNTSDNELLPKFKDVLNKKSSKKRFIVLHLYGSHPNPCDRLAGYPKIFKDSEVKPEYREINCYISSIRKTDDFISKVYQMLVAEKNNTGRTFSMVYFSDHGLNHTTVENNKIRMLHNKLREQLTVPLFKISSDDNERNVYTVFKSGMRFTEGLANWIGITNKNVNPNVDLFSNESDTDDQWLKKLLESRKEDPVIDIRP